MLLLLLLQVALYGLIAKMLLYTAPRTLTSQDNKRSNQARLQVGTGSPKSTNILDKTRHRTWHEPANWFWAQFFFGAN